MKDRENPKILAANDEEKPQLSPTGKVVRRRRITAGPNHAINGMDRSQKSRQRTVAGVGSSLLTILGGVVSLWCIFVPTAGTVALLGAAKVFAQVNISGVACNVLACLLTAVGFTTPLVLPGTLHSHAAFFKLEPVPGLRDSKPAAAVFRMSASDLFYAYNTDEVAINEEVRGKIIEIGGTIQSIDKDFTGDLIVQLATPNEFEPAQFRMLNSETVKATLLGNGQQITLRCRQMRRILGVPSANGCIFFDH